MKISSKKRHPLEKFWWHDAELLEIGIDRSNAGYKDNVTLNIRWPDGSKSKITFTDCYRLDAAMDFGIIALETIRTCDVTNTGNEIDDIREKWCSSGANFGDLFGLKLITNSTNSTIAIYALGYTIESWEC